MICPACHDDQFQKLRIGFRRIRAVSVIVKTPAALGAPLISAPDNVKPAGSP